MAGRRLARMTAGGLAARGGAGRALHPGSAAALGAPVPAGGRRLVVANLPYSVSGPLLAELVAAVPQLDAAVLLVQKAMAQRVAARPGSADYGGLSVAVQAAFAATSLRDVPPDVFRPRPKVVSAVLRLQRRADGLTEAAPTERREFLAFVRQLFGQRRKALRTTLARAVAAIGGAPPPLGDPVLPPPAQTIAPGPRLPWGRRSAGPRPRSTTRSCSSAPRRSRRTPCCSGGASAAGRDAAAGPAA